jgi:3-methyl-2-oxobutanoate hydroxymethyltransferase
MSARWLGESRLMDSYAVDAIKKPLSVLDLLAMKKNNEKISCLTAYDASFSYLIDQAGIDVMLVGDSLGMVIQGNSTTIPVTIDDMVYHTRCVVKARQRAFVIADLPFLSYPSIKTALTNAAKLMQSAGAQMVKLEGAHTEIIKSLVDFSVPVCAHLGLLPQSINQLGRYQVQGKKLKDAERIAQEAIRVEQAGASLLVLECIPAELASNISKQLTIPVIGIGAGLSCDGQVLVLYDMLGISSGKRPRFSKDFMQNADDIPSAIQQFHQQVKHELFPATEHCY